MTPEALAETAHAIGAERITTDQVSAAVVDEVRPEGWRTPGWFRRAER
jgi:hypothetical protein